MSKKKILKMNSNERKNLTSHSAPVLTVDTVNVGHSLLDEINKQVAVELTPKLGRKLESFHKLSISPESTINSASPDSSNEGHNSTFSEPQVESETTLTGNSFDFSDNSVFTEKYAPNSSHLGLLLLSNARRKLELEEERLEFEKEKQKEKEKRKAKKLFFKLSRRVKEKSTMPSILPSSISDGALKKIDDDGISSMYSSTFDRCNASTDSGLIPSSAEEREETIEEKVQRLEKELKDVRRRFAESEAECEKLKKTQRALDNEVHDLTETLFQQAYKMANAAEARRAHAEKLLREAQLKNDLLQAEAEALKEIVKSPGKRNLKDKLTGNHNSSHFTLKSKSKSSKAESTVSLDSSMNLEGFHELDPVSFEEFKEWRKSDVSTETEDSKFMNRLLTEDVQPCLTFANDELAKEVLDAIRRNTLEMEPVFDVEASPRTCALSNIEKLCRYRLRTDSDKEWVFISTFCRNRITAVCDLFTYLRYLKQGIVNAVDEDAFLEITTIRKNTALARFGFDFVAKMNGSGLTDKN